MKATQKYAAEKKAESGGEYGSREKHVPVRRPSPQPMLYDSRRDAENTSPRAELMRATKEWEDKEKKQKESDGGGDHVERGVRAQDWQRGRSADEGAGYGYHGNRAIETADADGK